MRRRLPAEVSELMGLDGAAVAALTGRTPVWRVDLPAGRVVVRRNDPALHPPSDAAVSRDLGWVHRFLTELASTTFPAPEPVPLLGEASVAIADGAVWEALTYLPGRVAGWSARPTVFRLGQFLARFHEAAGKVGGGGQREPCVPIDSLVDDTTWAGLRLGARDRRTLARSVDQLGEDLDLVDHGSAARSVIHGDFTSHNVLVSGRPVEPCGAIDFANAYEEATLADVGFSLWRSGRPFQRAEAFDPERIADYVAGYHSRRPMRQTDALAVVAYLRARGLQIIAKQALRLGVFETGPLPKLAWLSAHGPSLHRRLEVVLVGT